MLRNVTITPIESQETKICTAAPDEEIVVFSLLATAGLNGSEITFAIGDYTMTFTVAEDDTIILDHKIVVPSGKSLTVTADNAGVKISASYMVNAVVY